MVYDNPFYNNYDFSKEDIKRVTIGKWERFWLWFFPTFVQVNEGYAFYWKRVNHKLYLMKVEEI